MIVEERGDGLAKIVVFSHDDDDVVVKKKQEGAEFSLFSKKKITSFFEPDLAPPHWS